MSWPKTVQSILLFVSLIHATFSILCFECNNVLSARDCDIVTNCSSTSACYNRRFLTSNGNIYRQLGCKDKRRCPGAIAGKRKRSGTSDEITICEECCTGDFCQTKVCDDNDFAPDRGHLCYNCAQQLGGTGCEKVKECSRDEVCYESISGYLSSDRRTTGCMARSSCLQVKEQFKSLNFTSGNLTETWTDQNGVQRQQVKCFDCCDKDMCNIQCAIPATCQDTKSAAVCQTVSQFVCPDKDKARNAGCSKFCGHCT